MFLTKLKGRKNVDEYLVGKLCELLWTMNSMLANSMRVNEKRTMDYPRRVVFEKVSEDSF